MPTASVWLEQCCQEPRAASGARQACVQLPPEETRHETLQARCCPCGAGLFDVGKEVARLSKQREKLERDLAAVLGRVGNSRFMDKAPPAVVAEAMQAKADAEQKVAAIAAKIEQMLALT